MQGTQSIERAIQLLRLFDDDRPNWTLIELIDETGLKKTTVFRMLTALKNEGLLEHNGSTGRWGLGSELILLGGRAMRQHRLRDIANEHMRKLSRLSGESVTLDVLWIDEYQVPFSMVIDEVIGRHLLGLTQYIGTRLPAHATSTGKVLLAFQDEAELTELNFAQMIELTDDTLNLKDDLYSKLTHIRTKGYGTTRHELEVGIAGIAAPIFDLNNQVIAGISIAGPTSRISPEKLHSYAPILLEAAENISIQIGHRAKKSHK